jgi:phosphatase NudJ
MPRAPIPTFCYVLVAVRSGDRFLLVQETKHGQLWYVPAGRVEPGETFSRAALRETLEESGLPVVLDGILRVEHTPRPDYTRMRVIFLAHPADDSPPKSVPDSESLQAAWYTLDEMATLALRGDEVLSLCRAVASGCPVYPLELIRFEDEPFC